MKHIDLVKKDAAHHGKAGSWLHHGKLVHHKPGFFKAHLAGTFHHAHDSSIPMPSDLIDPLKLLP